MRQGNQYEPGYSDKELLDELRRVNELVDGPLTANEFSERSNVDDTTMRRRFGKWNDAKREAGLELAPRGRVRDGLKSKKNWVEHYKKSNSCKLCDESFYKCLNFHHTGEKEESISVMKGAPYSEYTLEDVKDEVDKCVLVCSNCHDKLHANESDLSL